MLIDLVAKPPRFVRETRRLSHGHVDGVMAVWHRVDAIAAKFKLSFDTESVTINVEEHHLRLRRF